MSEESVNSVHGHEVMQMMAESGRSYTRAELIQAIHDKFGADVRFHTCSSEQLSPDELIDFLESRGKFTTSSAGVGMNPADLCQ
jgi:probable metal-binding protein